MDGMVEELRRRIAQLKQAVDAGPGRRSYMPMEGMKGRVWLPEGAAAAYAEAVQLQQVVDDLLAMA